MNALRARNGGFTLVELLVALGLLTILSVFVVLVSNPIQLFKEARDAKRLAEVRSLSKAVEFALVNGASLGPATNIVYVSQPAPCSEGLPALADGWTYQCAPAESYQKLDGTGWLPVNVQVGLTTLPVDPETVPAEGLVYTYITSGQKFMLSAKFTSDKYVGLEATDGGLDDTRYEIGTDLNLWNAATGGGELGNGLIAHWRFDEGSGSVVGDSSGNDHEGSFVASPSWVSGVLGGALAFDGDDDGVAFGTTEDLQPESLTVAAWVKRVESWTGDHEAILFVWAKQDGWTSNGWYLERYYDECLNLVIDGPNYFSHNSGTGCANISTFYPLNEWIHIAATFDTDTNEGAIYRNGEAVSIGTPGSPDTITPTNTVKSIGDSTYGLTALFPGHMDDLRIYDRALSEEEIAALYELGS